MTHFISRRSLLKTAASLSLWNAQAQSSGDYRALVCVFLFGGNDGHNTIVPQSGAQLDRYKTIRGRLALPTNSATLLPITAPDGTPYGLHNALQAIHPFWAQKRLAVVANMGLLLQPVTRAQYLEGSVPLPSNLFSHSDQIQLMQNGGTPGSTSGWGGRVADAIQPANAGSSFPPSVSLSGTQIFPAGNIVKAVSLVPGFDLGLRGLHDYYPQSAADARKNGFQQLLTLSSGLTLVQHANRTMQESMDLHAIMKSASGSAAWLAPFPTHPLGTQMQEVARIIKLRASLGIARQIFFCSLGNFDTHGGQDYVQADLLKKLGDSLAAFYNATSEMGVADRVTTFTVSEFGRTLQPSGGGSDHGWGNHQLVLGGAVKGGQIYGAFPELSLAGPDDPDNRGALIPTTSLDQFGATLARWFGVAPEAMNSIFPNLSRFPQTDLGFV